MNRAMMIQIVVGVGLLVLLAQAAYTVTETEQVIITQFGDPVGDPVVDTGVALQGAVHPAHQLLRQAVPRMGWQSQPGADPGQAVHPGSTPTPAGASPTRCSSFSGYGTNGARSRGSTTFSTARPANAVARHDLIELVRSTNRNADDVPIESEEEAVILEAIERGRQEITRDILDTAADRTADLGIELLDLRSEADQLRRGSPTGRLSRG